MAKKERNHETKNRIRRRVGVAEANAVLCLCAFAGVESGTSHEELAFGEPAHPLAAGREQRIDLLLLPHHQFVRS